MRKAGPTGGEVFRLIPLPAAPARGRLIVAEAVINPTGRALRSFRGSDGRHEGIVFWVGRRSAEDTVVVSVITPQATHTRGSVRVEHAEVGRIARAARRLGLGLVAQVHSHPGTGTGHSDGDDQMILLPHEGMFSLVVARYGRGSVLPSGGAGLHQFQDGRWVGVADATEAMIIVSGVVPA